MLQGLRTLVVATKEIPEEEWAEWDANYQAAAADLDNRDEKVGNQNSRFTSYPVQEVPHKWRAEDRAGIGVSLSKRAFGSYRRLAHSCLGQLSNWMGARSCDVKLTSIVSMSSTTRNSSRFRCALAQLAAAAEEVERDLQLTGITAIEDKLQAGVPAAIETILMAGIKVLRQRACSPSPARVLSACVLPQCRTNVARLPLC